MRYINYHKHTHYSNIRTLDTITKPEDYIKRAIELGHKEYVTTEHGFQGNIYEAQTLCEKYGIKPIYGVEAYYVDDMNDKTNRESYHIILIAMNRSGQKQINKIMSLANTRGFYYKPRIDLECLLSLNPDDVVVTTACIASRMFKGNDWEEKFLIPVCEHFRKNFFLEIQSHVDLGQINYNKKILDVHKKYDIPLIHANDSHYILDNDAKYRDLFLRAKGIFYEDESGFVLDYPDSDDIFRRYEKQGVLPKELVQSALGNTLIFDNADPICIDKEFKIPNIKPEIIKEELHNSKFDTSDSDNVLREIIKRAWGKEKGNVKASKIPEYEKAIYYEHKEIGYNYRMSNIVAGIGRGQLKVLDKRIEQKTKIYNTYKQSFEGIKEKIPYLNGI